MNPQGKQKQVFKFWRWLLDVSAHSHINCPHIRINLLKERSEVGIKRWSKQS